MNQENRRPDADALLREIEREEGGENGQKGKLKIFLGYSPGVGKTYAMLNEAHVLKRRAIDVVVAYVETHGRQETEDLLKDLAVIPRITMEYKGLTLEEMDLNAVLKRRPQVALVDELAHTDAEGSRHEKRYQDVVDLLEAGIDVYTTLNVQHIESINDTVDKITGVRMQETIPDTFLERADEVQVIDIPWEGLNPALKGRKGLHSGKGPPCNGELLPTWQPFSPEGDHVEHRGPQDGLRGPQLYAGAGNRGPLGHR